MKTLNIYLTVKDKIELTKIKNKYHVSFSTICNIVTSHYIGWEYLFPKNYIKEKKGNKTSIKPKNQSNGIFYQNCINMFLDNTFQDYIKLSENEEQNKKSHNLIRNKIMNEINNTYEENWDGNRMQRIMPRMIKQNKEYYRKLLEE